MPTTFLKDVARVSSEANLKHCDWKLRTVLVGYGDKEILESVHNLKVSKAWDDSAKLLPFWKYTFNTTWSHNSCNCEQLPLGPLGQTNLKLQLSNINNLNILPPTRSSSCT